MMNPATKKPRAVRAAKAARRRVIRRRTDNQGSVSHPRKATIRLTVEDNARLMQLQGLARRFGKKTMAELFHNVCLPALEAHCKANFVPLARKAAEEAKARKAAREAVA